MPHGRRYSCQSMSSVKNVYTQFYICHNHVGVNMGIKLDYTYCDKDLAYRVIFITIDSRPAQ